MAYHVTSPITKSGGVLALQKMLNGDNPWHKDFFTGELDGEYGPITAGAVKDAKYWLGYPLSQVDGIANDQFILRMEGKKKSSPAMIARRKARRKKLHKSTLRARCIQIAYREIGVKEHPANSNSGPRVKEYQKVTGAYNAPWCASFQCWVLRQAGYKGKLPALPAYCPSWVSTAANHSIPGWRQVAAKDARPGDYALYDWNDDKRADHIGIMTSTVDSHDGFIAVEGNTAVGNDSNGGEVMQRSRNMSDVRMLVRATPL